MPFFNKNFRIVFVNLLVIIPTLGGAIYSADSFSDPGDPPKGQGNYSISGDLKMDFTNKTYFNDTSGIKAFAKREFDNLLTVITRDKKQESTTSVVFYIFNENTTQNIGAGTYSIESLTSSSDKGAFAFFVRKGEENKVYASMFAEKKTGTITIKSRGSNGLKGSFNNVKLANSKDDSKMVTLNGAFFAVQR